MNTKRFTWTTLVLFVAFAMILSACQSTAPVATPVIPIVVTPTVTPILTAPATPTLATPATALPSAIPPTKVVAATAPANTTPVATATGSATGMLDLGALLTPAVTAIAKGEIAWDLGAHGWNTSPGLSANEIAYMDTGVDGVQVVKNLPGQPDGTVILPDHAVLICGGTDAKVELTSGFSKSHSGGFYFALLPHTSIKSLWVKNGFCLVVDESQAQQEFAARVAQAISSNWDHGNVYQPKEWPALTGTYSTPLNSNR